MEKLKLKKIQKGVSETEYEKHKKVMNSNTVLVSINGTLGNLAFLISRKIVFWVKVRVTLTY